MFSKQFVTPRNTISSTHCFSLIVTNARSVIKYIEMNREIRFLGGYFLFLLGIKSEVCLKLTNSVS